MDIKSLGLSLIKSSKVQESGSKTDLNFTQLFDKLDLE